MQLPKQSIQIINNYPVQPIRSIQPPIQPIHSNPASIPPPFQQIHSPRPQMRFKDVPILPSQLINEHLQTAQSNTYYQHQLPLQTPTKPTKTLIDLINGVSKPVRRRRRKSRRQRKVRNNLEESINYWPDRLVSKNSYSTKPITNTGPFGRALNNIDAFAISLSGDTSKISSNNTINSSNSLKAWSPVKAENVLEAPFATSTSAGKTQMIIISSSRTISTSTDRTGNADNQQNAKHRKETVTQRPTQIQAPLKNKYNINYDDNQLLEEEFEILQKDE